jgi:hypothetical protein
MLNEVRILFRQTPELEPEKSDMVSESEAKEVDRHKLEEAKEYAEAAAKIAVGVETGDWAEASMTFYKAFLETPEKMKRYRDFMMLTTNPLLWVSRNAPIFGLLAKLQIYVTDKAIDRLHSVMSKVRDLAEDNEATKLLKKVQGQWEQLSPEEQELVKTMLSDCVK